MIEALAQRIAMGADALSSSSTDFSRWSELAHALYEAEAHELAKEAYYRLGVAASRYGHVALALACACQLRDMGESKLVEELVSATAKLHCRGSSVVDGALAPAPPVLSAGVPPSLGASSGAVTMDEALEAAKAALAKAADDAERQAPPRLAPTPLVEGLSRDELRELARVVNHRHVPAGHIVIDVGEPATTLFWIGCGEVVVSRGEHELGELRSNAFFGEIALVGATDRTARVTAKSPCWILDIPAESVEKLAGRSPRLAKVLANYARSRILSNVMRTSPLFSRLSEEERRSLLPKFQSRLLNAGDKLIEGGAANDVLYVLASGALEVRDGDRVVAVLTVGDGVGEQSLLSRKVAAFDVVASSQAVVLGLRREQFDDLAVAHPGLLAEAYKLLVEREQSGGGVVHDATELII